MDVLKRSLVLLAILSVARQAAVLAGTPVGTTITYQGQLKEAGVPLNGNVDLRFELFDAEVLGNPIGSPLLLEEVSLVKGLFSVELDFGAAAFTGDARWAQIEVQVPQDGGGTLVVPLSPRQPLTAAPYALFSLAPWQQNGNDVSYTAGNVGIGTTAPQKALHLDLPPNSNEGILLAKAGTSHGTQLAVSGSNNQQFCIDIDPNNVSAFENFQVRYNGVSTVLVIDDEGNVGIGTTTPDVPLHVIGGNPATLAAGGSIQAGFTSGLNVVIDNNEVMARFDGATSDLLLNINGGDVIFGGGAVFAGTIDIGYEIVTANVEGNSAIANCPVGKRVIGGGCDTLGATLGDILRSHPLPDGSGWSCIIEDGPFEFEEVAAYAICANLR